MITKAPKSSSVIYSFESRWEEPLRQGQVSVFFRKRKPIILPRYTFFYIKSPVKAIIGHSRITEIQTLTLVEAVAIRRQGGIGEAELVSYVGRDSNVHAIMIGRPNIYRETISLDVLAKNYGFFPPQSFSIPTADFAYWLIGHHNEEETN